MPVTAESFISWNSYIHITKNVDGKWDVVNDFLKAVVSIQFKRMSDPAVAKCDPHLTPNFSSPARI